MNALAMAVDDVDGASVPAISTLLLKNEIDDGMSICWGLDIRYPYCGGVRTTVPLGGHHNRPPRASQHSDGPCGLLLFLAG